MSDLFLCFLAGIMALVASLERPDRYMFWVYCAWFCIAVNLFHLIGAAS